jgi:hypothetical protein
LLTFSTERRGAIGPHELSAISKRKAASYDRLSRFSIRQDPGVLLDLGHDLYCPALWSHWMDPAVSGARNEEIPLAAFLLC